MFVKVIYRLSEKVEKGNQLERFNNRKMMAQVCMALF